MAPPTLTLREFSERLALPYANEEFSAATGTPLVLVDFDASASSAHHAAARTSALRESAAALSRAVEGLACVVVGVAGSHDIAMRHLLGTCFDTVVGRGSPDLGRIVEVVGSNPIAATSFAVLLRQTAAQSTAAGLAAESAVYSALQSGPEFAAWRSTRVKAAESTSAEAVVVGERHGNDVVITLTRPQKHNAFSRQMRDELAALLDAAAGDATIVNVTLRGAGRSFCSGGDLDEFGLFDSPAHAHVVRLTRSVARQLAVLAPRLTVELHGAALGAGLELAAFASRVIAAPDTVCGLPEVSLGLVPGAGGTVSLPRRIGRQRTALLGLTARPIDAATALRWGLVDAISG
jgi:hypothetical protein